MARPTQTLPALDDILRETTFRDDTVEVVFTAESRVMCDGPGGALGHPRVYYTIGDKGFAECMYCDRVFVLDPARAGQRIEGQPATAPGSALPQGTPATEGDSGA